MRRWHRLTRIGPSKAPRFRRRWFQSLRALLPSQGLRLLKLLTVPFLFRVVTLFQNVGCLFRLTFCCFPSVNYLSASFSFFQAVSRLTLRRRWFDPCWFRVTILLCVRRKYPGVSLIKMSLLTGEWHRPTRSGFRMLA